MSLSSWLWHEVVCFSHSTVFSVTALALANVCRVLWFSFRGGKNILIYAQLLEDFILIWQIELGEKVVIRWISGKSRSVWQTGKVGPHGTIWMRKICFLGEIILKKVKSETMDLSFKRIVILAAWWLSSSTFSFTSPLSGCLGPREKKGAK